MSAALLFALIGRLDRVPQKAMGPRHRLLLVMLADFADELGRAWPSVAKLVQRTGQSRSTVQVQLGELRAAGWLGVEDRAASARQSSTVYLVRLEGSPLATRPEPGPPARPDTGPALVHGSPEPGPPCPEPGPDPIRDPIPDPQGSSGARAPTLERTVELDAQTPPAVRGLEHVPELERAPLSELVQALVAEGSPLGASVAERMAKGWRPTSGQLDALRKIAAERLAKPRAPPRAAPTLQPAGPPGARAWSEASVSEF